MSKSSGESPLKDKGKCATIRLDGKRTLSECSAEELEQQIDQIERHTIPFLNALRAARGKKPVIVPKE